MSLSGNRINMHIKTLFSNNIKQCKNQTVKTLIRRLLQEPSDLGLHCLKNSLVYYMHTFSPSLSGIEALLKLKQMINLAEDILNGRLRVKT